MATGGGGAVIWMRPENAATGRPAGHSRDEITAAAVAIADRAVATRLLAENIGESTVSGDRVEAIVEAWMRSHDHRENVLNPAFNTAGVAVVDGPGGKTIVVELYATFQ